MKLILARDKNGGVGFNNSLPWPHIKEDMDWFRQCTAGKVVVMGMNTFKSLGSNPLPDRTNIVITSEPETQTCPNTTFMTLGEFMRSEYTSSAWVIGGAKLATTLLPLIDSAYITEVNGEYDCDTFFDMDLTKKEFTKTTSHHLSPEARVDVYWRN